MVSMAFILVTAIQDPNMGALKTISAVATAATVITNGRTGA
jgi:hypothetical protein